MARSPRTVFTGLLSGLSTLFGVGLMTLRYGDQADNLTDVLKIALFMAVCSTVLAFVFWTLLQGNRERQTPLRGALAGGLTALCLIPLPFFFSTFKDGAVALYKSGEAGLVSAVLRSLPPAVETGALTFVYLTKASLIALILSAALGFVVAKGSPRAGNY